MILFDVQVYGPVVYGSQGGVMSAYEAEADSAEQCADQEAEQWRGYPAAETVAVWAKDRRSGHAQREIAA